MAGILACPTQEQLHALLEGRLSADEQPSIAEHIDRCASCQTTLESIRLSGQSWVDVAPALVESGAESPMLQEVLQRAKAGGASATTDGESALAGESWSFLQPSDNPDHLGRLDTYQILALIGKGGMGIVFRGFDEKLHRMVAIKVMAPQLATSAVARQRFIREARAAAAVSHDHVVSIYAVANDAPLPYLVMQLVGGQSLQEKLDRVGPLGLREILRIGMQTAEGLAAAHKQGLVHRDIKPANILLENGVERVKLTDFGLARTRDDASVTQSGMIAGSPQFMAPEQAAGEAVDYRSDLFSLGSVLYAMCAGRAPFRASNAMAVLKRVCDEVPTPIREINPDIPDWLAEIITRLQQKKPSERFQSAHEVAELLGQYLAELQQPGQARWVASPGSSGTPGAGRGSPDPVPGSDRRSPELEGPKGDLRSGEPAGSGDPRRAPEQPKWKSGDRVMAPWSDGWLYPARVHEMNGDSVFVWFDDGATAWVNAGDLRPLDIGKGSHVFDEWGYLVQVTARDGDRIHIAYDDGTVEWTTLQHICMPATSTPAEGSGSPTQAFRRVVLLILSMALAAVFVFTRRASDPDGSTTTSVGTFDPWLVYNTGPEGGTPRFNAVSWSFASGVLAVLLFMRSFCPQKIADQAHESESALARLRNASIGLFITGILYWATIPILFAARFSGLMQPEHVPYLWWTLGVFPAIAGFVLIFGAWKMRHGEMYPVCLLAAILPLGMLLEKLINFRDGRLAISPGDVTALPFGMWALIVLTRRDVRAAFAAGAPQAPRMSAGYFLVALALAGYWFGPGLYRYLTNQGADTDHEVVLKRVDPKEPPISTGGFYQGKESEGHWRFLSGMDGRTVRLHLVENPDVNGEQLTLRAWMSGNVKGGPGVEFAGKTSLPVSYDAPTSAYLQLVGHFAGGAVVTSPKRAPLLEGFSSWQSYQASLTAPKGMKLERLELNLIMLPPAHPEEAIYVIEIKDIELVKSPATGSPQPVVIRAFDPAKDKVLHGDSAVEAGAWKVNYQGVGNPGHIRLFRVPDLTVSKQGNIIFRAKLKAQRSTNVKDELAFGMYLSIGREKPPFAPDSGARDFASLDWATYEAVYPTSMFQDVGATGLPLDLMVLGSGTVWIKDVELLYVSETK